MLSWEFLTTALIGLLHVVLPNHWLPISLLAVEYHWKKTTLIFYAGLLAFLHALSTIIAGIFVRYLGHSFLDENTAKYISASIFFLLGFYYLFTRNKQSDSTAEQKSSSFVLGSLLIGMFFSPCLEMQGVYLRTVTKSWNLFWSLSLLYLMISMIGITLMSYAGNSILTLMHRFGFLKYNRHIYGVIFIVIAIFILLVFQ